MPHPHTSTVAPKVFSSTPTAAPGGVAAVRKVSVGAVACDQPPPSNPLNDDLFREFVRHVCPK